MKQFCNLYTKYSKRFGLKAWNTVWNYFLVYNFLDPSSTPVWMILTLASPLLRKYCILSVTVLEPASAPEIPAASRQHSRERQVKVRRTTRFEWRARLYRRFRIRSATLLMINGNKQTKLFDSPMCDRAATTTTAVRHSHDQRAAFEADRPIVWCGGAGPPAARAHRRGYSVATMLTSCVVVVLVAALATTASGDIVHAEKFYIDKIFDKYGDKGVITFEVSVSYSFHIQKYLQNSPKSAHSRNGTVGSIESKVFRPKWQ